MGLELLKNIGAEEELRFYLMNWQKSLEQAVMNMLMLFN